MYIAFILGGAILGERVSLAISLGFYNNTHVLDWVPRSNAFCLLPPKVTDRQRYEANPVGSSRYSMQALTQCGMQTTKGCALCVRSWCLYLLCCLLSLSAQQWGACKRATEPFLV